MKIGLQQILDCGGRSRTETVARLLGIATVSGRWLRGVREGNGRRSRSRGGASLGQRSGCGRRRHRELRCRARLRGYRAGPDRVRFVC